jgi:hypothetical protein
MQFTKLEPTPNQRLALVGQLRDLRVALGLALPWTRPQIGSFPDGSLTIRLDHMPGGSGALLIGPGSLRLWYLSELRLDPGTGRAVAVSDPRVIADEFASIQVVSIEVVRHSLRVWQEQIASDETPEAVKTSLAASVETTHARLQRLSEQLFT